MLLREWSIFHKGRFVMAVCSKPASLVQILHSRVIDCVILDMEQTNCAICLILILLLLHECVVTVCFLL